MLSEALSSKWAIFFAAAAGILLHFAPSTSISYIWTSSLLLKQMIILGLPFVMFALISSALLQIGKRSLKIVLLLSISSFIINVIAFWILYPVALFSSVFQISERLAEFVQMMRFPPIWEISMPVLIRNDVAVLAGVIFALLILKFYDHQSDLIGDKLSKFAHYVLNKIFTPAINIFVLGFIANLNFTNFLLPMILSHYQVLIVIIISQWAFIYTAIAMCNGPKRAIQNIKNTSDAAVIGFTTMSSAMALPRTLEAMKKNGVSKNIIAAFPVVSISAGIGDCLTISGLAFFVLFLFGLPIPDPMTYFIASLYYGVLKFSVCSMPGGAIISIMPALVMFFSFNDEMSMLIASLCLAFDPFTAMANTSSHGMFAIILHRLFGKFTEKIK